MTRVRIPAELHAEYEEGAIVRFVVSPLESYAGYFGPPSEVVEGDETLDVKDTDGPFWRAVQSSLGTAPFDWEE